MAHVRGLHHVTLLASSAPGTDRFLRSDLGLARVKRTVNADRPDAYHLIYGDAAGAAGTLVTVHPFANLARGRPGMGEIGDLAFAVGVGSTSDWRDRVQSLGRPADPVVRHFDRNRLGIEGPDGERIMLQVDPQDPRPPRPLPFDGRSGLRGLHSVSIRVRDGEPVARLLATLGYAVAGTDGNVERHSVVAQGASACAIDIQEIGDAPDAVMGAGSVHHAAFAVDGADALREMREALSEAGIEPGTIGDRTYFDSFFFRGPEGLLFEVATAPTNFAADEDPARLGETLALPHELEGERSAIETRLEPLGD